VGYFKNTKDVVDCIGSLFEWAGDQKEIADKLKATGLVIRLNYTDPEAVLTIDCANPPRKPGHTISWFEGDGGLTPEVEFFMKSDVAHKFWLGKVNLLVALTKRDVVAKGPIFKIMKILPILKPLYDQYPKILESKGRSELAKV
jgi:hypothetical protein